MRRRKTWTCPWRIRNSVDDGGPQSDLEFTLWRVIDGEGAAVAYQKVSDAPERAHGEFPPMAEKQGPKTAHEKRRGGRPRLCEKDANNIEDHMTVG